MLSSKKLNENCEERGKTTTELAEAISRTGLSTKSAAKAIENWKRSKFVPQPKTADIDALARAFGVERQDITIWSACHRYAPMAPRKIRLVTDLIRGRSVQDALDVLKFANKRAAVMVDKVLRSAIASADEAEADVERLYVAEARADEGGVRTGTRRWRPKDRGRAVSWTRLASHIHVAVKLEE